MHKYGLKSLVEDKSIFSEEGVKKLRQMIAEKKKKYLNSRSLLQKMREREIKKYFEQIEKICNEYLELVEKNKAFISLGGEVFRFNVVSAYLEKNGVNTKIWSDYVGKLLTSAVMFAAGLSTNFKILSLSLKGKSDDLSKIFEDYPDYLDAWKIILNSIERAYFFDGTLKVHKFTAQNLISGVLKLNGKYFAMPLLKGDDLKKIEIVDEIKSTDSKSGDLVLIEDLEKRYNAAQKYAKMGDVGPKNVTVFRRNTKEIKDPYSQAILCLYPAKGATCYYFTKKGPNVCSCTANGDINENIELDPPVDALQKMMNEIFK